MGRYRHVYICPECGNVCASTREEPEPVECDKCGKGMKGHSLFGKEIKDGATDPDMEN